MCMDQTIETGDQTMKDILLHCEKIGKNHKEKYILEDCTFSLEKGSFSVIVGPSGCGKTTLLEILSGLQEMTQGEIWLQGEKGANPNRVAVVFQEPTLFPYLNVLENIAFGADQNAALDVQKKAEEIAALLELSDLKQRRADTLSGGEKQRVAIGRALMKEADLILMDEPFSALDVPLKHSLGDKLRALQKQLSLTILYVTHDQREALRLSDHLIVMNNGHILQQGTPKEIYEHPETTFVAGFIGYPPMNLVEASVQEKGLFFHSVFMPFVSPILNVHKAKVIVGIRPSQIMYKEGNSNARCKEIIYYGEQIQAIIEWEGYELKVVLPSKRGCPPFGEIVFDLDDCIFFDSESGQRIDCDY